MKIKTISFDDKYYRNLDFESPHLVRVGNHYFVSHPIKLDSTVYFDDVKGKRCYQINEISDLAVIL